MEAGALPELAAVPWRRRASEGSLRRRGQLWTLTTVAHVVPFIAVAVVLMLLQPLSAPVAVAALAHAWIIPELYAVRGANTIRPKRREPPAAEPVAQGFLGDLLNHQERDLHRSTGLALERGRLGVWLVGEAGAVLVTPRDPDSEIAWIRLRVSPDGSPAGLAFQTSAGDRTEFEFHAFRSEAPKDASAFTVHPPAGTQIIENER